MKLNWRDDPLGTDDGEFWVAYEKGGVPVINIRANGCIHTRRVNGPLQEFNFIEAGFKYPDDLEELKKLAETLLWLE